MMKARAPPGSRDPRREVENLNGLAKFLELKGHTLLIKGYAGKTTLALRLLKHFGNDRGVYVSTRVSKAKLRDGIPWSGDLFESEEFEDVRLGDSASMTKRVIDAITGRRVRAIVLDTWDAIAKEPPNEKERLMAEKNLISLADNSEARVIFVSEEPGKTTMDFIVDGTVELVRTEEAGRIVRVAEFQKLQGTYIDQHKYIYTLQGGGSTTSEPTPTPTSPWRTSSP
jgi:regulator of extracellular matrix RemA (YlzA/DUF370 family)